MEKQMKEETIMEENKKKNPDSERKSKLVSAILMAFVCVVMMGGGTYAWFTMSNTARVNSLKLNVAAEGNLRISKTNHGATHTAWQNVENNVTWYDENETVKTLYPCTADTNLVMKKPLYSSEKNVNKLETIDNGENSADKDVYYLEQKFYLFMDEGGDANNATYNVCLVQNDSSASTDETKGTYFISGTANGSAEYCARVSFQAGEAKAVYEPNSDGTIANPTIATTSYTDYTPFASKHQQSKDGAFTHVDSGVKPLNDGDSDALFTIQGDTPTEVTVRVWFEGTDAQCCNEIQLKDIVAQLKFVANKATTQ